MTHGRGMDELQRAKFILSTPLCSEIKCALESMTQVKYGTSEQHKSSRVSRIDRDYEDAFKILKYFIDRSPFDEREELINIETGEVAAAKVNVYDSKEIGNSILIKMQNQSVFDYSFRRKDMAVTMKSRSAVEVDGEIIPIDNQLLFQRLSILAERGHVDLQTSLSYELSSIPATLFFIKVY